MKLLSDGRTNHKIGKNDNKQYRLFSLNLRPYKTSVNGKIKNVCPHAGQCSKTCVGDNGHFSMKNGSAYKAQLRKTRLYFTDPKAFYQKLFNDMIAAKEIAKRADAVAVFRLNAYSDINHSMQSKRYLGVDIYDFFYDCIFYDYTKDFKKALTNDKVNYKITYSFSEKSTIGQLNQLLKSGKNVAVVFEQVPERFLGWPVFDGDITDNRFIDPEGHIIGLKFKGSKVKKLNSIKSGFTISKNQTHA